MVPFPETRRSRTTSNFAPPEGRELGLVTLFNPQVVALCKKKAELADFSEADRDAMEARKIS